MYDSGDSGYGGYDFDPTLDSYPVSAGLTDFQGAAGAGNFDPGPLDVGNFDPGYGGAYTPSDPDPGVPAFDPNLVSNGGGLSDPWAGVPMDSAPNFEYPSGDPNPVFTGDSGALDAGSGGDPTAALLHSNEGYAGNFEFPQFDTNSLAAIPDIDPTSLTFSSDLPVNEVYQEVLQLDLVQDGGAYYAMSYEDTVNQALQAPMNYDNDPSLDSYGAGAHTPAVNPAGSSTNYDNDPSLDSYGVGAQSSAANPGAINYDNDPSLDSYGVGAQMPSMPSSTNYDNDPSLDSYGVGNNPKNYDNDPSLDSYGVGATMQTGNVDAGTNYPAGNNPDEAGNGVVPQAVQQAAGASLQLDHTSADGTENIGSGTVVKVVQPDGSTKYYVLEANHTQGGDGTETTIIGGNGQSTSFTPSGSIVTGASSDGNGLINSVNSDSRMTEISEADAMAITGGAGPAKLSSAPAVDGEQVFIVAHPFGDDSGSATLASGRVFTNSAGERYILFDDGSVVPGAGASGGAILNANGDVLGTYSGTMQNGLTLGLFSPVTADDSNPNGFSINPADPNHPLVDGQDGVHLTGADPSNMLTEPLSIPVTNDDGTTVSFDGLVDKTKEILKEVDAKYGTGVSEKFAALSPEQKIEFAKELTDIAAQVFIPGVGAFNDAKILTTGVNGIAAPAEASNTDKMIAGIGLALTAGAVVAGNIASGGALEVGVIAANLPKAAERMTHLLEAADHAATLARASNDSSNSAIKATSGGEGH